MGVFLGICEIFQKTFFFEHIWTTSSEPETKSIFRRFERSSVTLIIWTDRSSRSDVFFKKSVLEIS